MNEALFWRMEAERHEHVPCKIDWAAFGLAAPDPWPGSTVLEPCSLSGVYLVRQGCVHEHISEARVCCLHLAMLMSFAPSGEWGCARCLPEQVCAPLIVTRTIGVETPR
jgi:hypothetical protein